MKHKTILCAALIAMVTSANDANYTVVKHDNLWNLSAQHLGKPELWPQIWKSNPQVRNPHWIYPGDKLSMPNGSDTSKKTEKKSEKEKKKSKKDKKNSNSHATSPSMIEATLQSYYLNHSDLYSISVLRSAPYLPSKESSDSTTAKIADNSRQVFTMSSIATVKMSDKNPLAVGEEVDILHSQKTLKKIAGTPEFIIPVGSAIVESISGESARIRITNGWDKIVNGDNVIHTRDFKQLKNPKVDFSVSELTAHVLTPTGSNAVKKPFEKMIIDAGIDKDVAVGDIFIATGENKKGVVDAEPAFRGIIIRTDATSSTLLVEEVCKYSSAENFKLKRAARLQFE